jgi:hypothetical protein
MSIKMKFTGLVLSLLLHSGAALASAGDFNKGLKAFAAGDFKTVLATELTPADISKAQEMSSQCLKSNYTDC